MDTTKQFFKVLLQPAAYRRGEAGKVPYQVAAGERLSPSQFLERAQRYTEQQSQGHLYENYHLGGRLLVCGLGSFMAVVGAAATTNPRISGVMSMFAVWGITGMYFGNHFHKAMRHQSLFHKYSALSRNIAAKRHYCETYGEAESQRFVPEFEREMTRLFSKNDQFYKHLL